MSADCAVCYVSDVNFLLPSIVSAIGVRKFVPAHKADILIFTVGVEAGKSEATDQFLQTYGIRAVSLDERAFSQIDKERLSKSHTPMAMFGRLFMDDLLPEACKRIVYIDGDTWVERDPSALIDAVVPEGRFAAAEDTIFFRQNMGFGKTTEEIRAYFKGLNLDRKYGYFNSGIFATSRTTWKTISQEAYAYYLENADACEHSPDQSALNAIMGDRRLRLSSKWNFQTQYRFWGVERFVEPCIYHFNRFPKPWMGPCDPWKEMYPKYQGAIAPFAPLQLPLKTISAEQLAECNAIVDKSYSYLKLPFVSRLALLSMGYQSIERSSWL
ncbi:MAG: hypothetical protein M3N08_00415 [Pseudomonadota bacterium]|nr:hypothetical protein [Pseudomonadota bacterium]